MNKKGFTLIELLTVIILIGLIATLSFKIVSASIAEAKERNYNTLIETFKDASKKYLLEKSEDEDHVNVLCISLSDLQREGYLELGKIKNPKTGEYFNLNNDGISAKYNDSTKQYDLQLYTGGSCTQSTNNKLLASYILEHETISPSSGAGLYETNDSYVYRGEANNYIKMGTYTFRIINIDKETKQLKVIAINNDNSSLSNLAQSLNQKYIGDDSTTGSYDSIKEYIAIDSKWNSGKVDTKGSYKSVLSQEKSSNTYQTINLLSLSDYIESKINGNTYLPTNTKYWLMTKASDEKNWYIDNDTPTTKTYDVSDTSYKYPVFYLKANVQWSSGDGSSSTPYQITINEDQD